MHGQGAQDEETRDFLVVFDELGLEDDLLIPRGEVLGLGDGDTDDIGRLLSAILLATDNGNLGMLCCFGRLLGSEAGRLLSLLGGALGLLGGGVFHLDGVSLYFALCRGEEMRLWGREGRLTG